MDTNYSILHETEVEEILSDLQSMYSNNVRLVRRSDTLGDIEVTAVPNEDDEFEGEYVLHVETFQPNGLPDNSSYEISTKGFVNGLGFHNWARRS